MCCCYVYKQKKKNFHKNCTFLTHKTSCVAVMCIRKKDFFLRFYEVWKLYLYLYNIYMCCILFMHSFTLHIQIEIHTMWGSYAHENGSKIQNALDVVKKVSISIQ